MKLKQYITPNLKVVNLNSEDICLIVGSETTEDPTMLGKKNHYYDEEEDWDD